MKRLVIPALILATLVPFRTEAQQQPDGRQQDKPTTLQSQYRKEKSTIPYDVRHKIAKQRRTATRSGNKSLKKDRFSDAVTNYRNALKADSNYSKAQYNAAVAHAKLQQNDTALSYYQRVCDNTGSTAEQREKAHYNAGNIHLRQAIAARDTGGYDGQNLRAAIEQYKSALRLNSKNREAQHNLSLAKQLLRPEQQQGGGGGGDQNQQNQQQQQQQQNQQQNQDQQQQQSQGQQDKKQQEQHSREAERMLNAMKNNEQQTMKSVRLKEAEKERRQGNPARIEKDW